RGGLAESYDLLIFVDGAIPARDGIGSEGPAVDPRRVPAEYAGRLGRVTVRETVPRLAQFLEAGGTIVTVGRSTVLASLLGLPVCNAVAEAPPNGRPRPLESEDIYIPGSVLEARVDASHPLAWGLGEAVDLVFNQIPAFRIGSNAAGRLAAVAEYGPAPL